MIARLLKPLLVLPLLLAGNAAKVFCQTPLYKQASQPVEKRVADLLGRMTAEEKFWQLFMIPGDLDPAAAGQYKNGLFGFQVSAGSGNDAGGQLLTYNTGESALLLAKKINGIQKYFVEQTRLGIPIIPFDEALHGLVRNGATVFPQAIGLAATWDTTLMKQVSAAIARQARQRGIRQILSPVVNIATDVRWGRTEETYGEDPFLAAAMGVAFVKSFESAGIITTPKHFIANVGDGGKDSYPVHANDRLLNEVLLVPFKACFEKGGSRSVMTAYNSLDGTACSANSYLLTDKLKKQWGFTGFVISDANAVGGEVVLHHTAKDYAASGAHALNNGLDVIFQTEYKHHELFWPAFAEKQINDARLNDAVARVLKAKFELGLFENPYTPEVKKDAATAAQDKMLAQRAAQEAFVLLKNENYTLPLSNSVKTIAVLGPDATEARLGGYSGPGVNKISILEGIKKRAGNRVNILYAKGATRNGHRYATIPAAFLRHNGAPGLQAEYFNNIELTGRPVVNRRDKEIDFHWTLYAPAKELPADFYSVRWAGSITAPATGHIKIGLEGNDGFRLFINNKLLINNWKKQSYSTLLTSYYFEKDKQYNLRVEFFEPNGNATIRLIWNAGENNLAEKELQQAVALARKADVAIIAAGINEGEFSDRALLSLPGNQEELINAVAATGKPVIVLLAGGSAVTMTHWLPNVQAVGCAWYPGEEGGHAVARILFGDYNPAGRLPVSFPVHEAQLPFVYNHKPTGRGDDYNNLTGLPLFPFGFGLSYTRFSYSNLSFSQNTMGVTDSSTASFTVTNTGTLDGDEVVQLYIRDELASVARPVMELKGFQRVTIKAGESKQLHFTITPELLTMLNKDMQPVVEPGDFRIMIGASSADMRLKGTVTVQ
jgi:beta-glucosidase